MKRRTTEILSILSIALIVGAVWAQPPGGGQGPPEGRGRGAGRGAAGGPQGEARPMMNPLMMALDADRNGEISKEEIENAAKALKKLDKNDDGKITREEMRPEGGPGMGGPGMGAAGGRGGPGGGPGAGGPGAGGMVERLMSHDTNGDGKVDKDELPEQMQRILERADLNKDDAIDKAEAEKLAERFSQMGGRGGRGGQAAAGGRGGQGGGRGGRGAQGGGRPQRPE